MASEVTPEKEAYIRELRGLDIGKVRTVRNPETGFVYPVFADRVLTVKEDQTLKDLVEMSYPMVLESLLKQYGHIQTCANRLIVGSNAAGSLLFDIDSLSVAQRTRLEQNAPTNKWLHQYLEALNTFPTHIEEIKKEFYECPVPYFLLFVKVMTYEGPRASGHANILIFNKAKGTVMWIDPAIREETGDAPPYFHVRRVAFGQLANRIGLKSPRMILPAVDVCPQLFTDDQNCMFWSLLTILLFILNPSFIRQDDLYEFFYTAAGMRLADGGNRDDAKILRYIENFKASLVPPKGGRHKTYRKKRRTTRKKMTTKSNGFGAKSGRKNAPPR